MIDLPLLQKNIGSWRYSIAAANLELQKARAELAKLNAKEKQQLNALNEQAKVEQQDANNVKRKEILSSISRLSGEKNSFEAELQALYESSLPQLNPVNTVEQLNDAYPLLLFPLRLETRFKSAGNQPQLWVRVYPDDCNINKKEDLLSESELSGAKLFWSEMWKAGRDETIKRGVWRSLVNSFGSGRASWIIKQYKPVSMKPLKPAKQDKTLLVISSLKLSDSESIAAENYWISVWLARGNKELSAEAFELLVQLVNKDKALEIVQNYIPINISDEVPDMIIDLKVSLKSLILPADEDYITTQTSWTTGARAFALPDKFVAITYRGTKKNTILFDNPVKENLGVGIDPSLGSGEQIRKDDNDGLTINDDLNWMFDFDNAVQCGMGIKINLTPDEAKKGFDKLFVVGIRFSSNEMNSKIELEKLISDHFYDKNGFEIIKQGTPTNNTGENPSGYSWSDNADESYDRIFNQTSGFVDTEDLSSQADGQKLADYLGIDSSVLQTIPNAGGTDIQEANAMNIALFPATMGYFMEEMMHPLYNSGDIDRAKWFFTNYVSGRGPVPAIRIGRQPYGILPVSVYSKISFDLTPANSSDPEEQSKVLFLNNLHRLLAIMDSTWDNLMQNVAYVGKPSADPHQVLLDVIGLHANSIEFHQRFAQSIRQIYYLLLVQSGIPKFKGEILDDFKSTGQNILNQLWPNLGFPSILSKYFLSNPNLLSGPLVDDAPLSEINPAGRHYAFDRQAPQFFNYLDWLYKADPEKIRREDFGVNDTVSSPNSLLYLLLRHSLMQSQADAAAQVLVTYNGESKESFLDADFIHVKNDFSDKSKFEQVFGVYREINNRLIQEKGYDSNLEYAALIDFIYKTGFISGSVETKRLTQTLDAIERLKNIPTARLERLLTEHIDCCSYRLDAWKTGLVNYKLIEQRTNKQNNNFARGIYLGAYGWLLDVRPANKVLKEVELPDELKPIFQDKTMANLQVDPENLGYIHAPSLNQAAAAAILRNTYNSNKNSGSGNPFAINLTSNRVRIATGILEGLRNGQSLSALLGYRFERGLHDNYESSLELNQYILPLRKAFPLAGNKMKDTKSPAGSEETIEANNVVDGLKLINTSLPYPYGASGMPPDNFAKYDDIRNAIESEVKNIGEINDAISDMLIGEQIYQVVQGNFERVSGNADAFSKGGYPPEMDIINTPRSGVNLTHKMAIHFDVDPGVDPSLSPNSMTMTPRANADPIINRWLNTILPDPANVLCKVLYSSPVQAESPVYISQESLGLQPIDLLYVLNLDSENSMSQLDDRIFNHVQYDISKHPKTSVKIKYTEQIDSNDRKKISFFELAALVKSLRKILIGSKFLSPSEITVSAGKGKIPPVMDEVQLKNRIVALNDGLAVEKNEIDSILANVKSVSGLSGVIKTSLSTVITDPSVLDEIINKFRSDLMNYLLNPVAGNKSDILGSFENSISSVDAAQKTILVNEYGNQLEEYKVGFLNFDEMANSTVGNFQKIALYDHSHTATGFIHQGISGVYDSIFAKLDKLIERWEKKGTDYASLISAYNIPGTPEEQKLLLQKAERMISSQSTYPVPPVLADYKTIVDNKKLLFDTLLNNLQSLKITGFQSVIEFIVAAELYINNIGGFDVISFDIKNNKNNLTEEKMMIASLKEDIIVALNNVQTLLAGKIALTSELINASGGSADNIKKISILQEAAKTILGDEALLMPWFLFEPALANEFQSCYQKSDELLHFVSKAEGRIFPVDDWLGGVAKVREKVQYWENASFYSNALKWGNQMQLQPLQFPFQAKDRWAALKFRLDATDDFAINNDKLLYTAHFATAFNPSHPQCGIIIDEWTELIPAKEETTGIAFHYDGPNSEAPQTMLLVTPPVLKGNWKWDEIIEAMEETLEMAKKRAVEPSQIETTGYSQFLPATMMALTLNWITVSTNLAINDITINEKYNRNIN